MTTAGHPVNSTWPSRGLRRWGATVVVVTTIVVGGYLWWVAPTIDQIFMNASDDHCSRASNGEPDRNDLDCYTGEWDGRNYVEEWDRAHPSP